jgi:hypothetical protein
VTSVAQVAAMAEVCTRLEQAYGLPGGRLGFEIQVETAQAVLDARGVAAVAPMITAAQGRCTGLHYGTYDYSAGLGISAAYQSLEHPAADVAKAVMQLAAAGTGVRLSDGSTNVLPTGDGDAVRAAWQLHARLVRRSLERGYYQGWDMHPGHLPTRYLATYGFFREALGPAAARLRTYLGRVEGGIMDEPATAQALAMTVLRGVHCGAVDPARCSRPRACRSRRSRRWPGGRRPDAVTPAPSCRRAPARTADRGKAAPVGKRWVRSSVPAVQRLFLSSHCVRRNRCTTLPRRRSPSTASRPTMTALPPVRSLSRRSVLTGGLLLGGALATGVALPGVANAAAAPRLRSSPFTLGVASGDPTATGIVLWTRLAVDPLADDGSAGCRTRRTA